MSERRLGERTESARGDFEVYLQSFTKAAPQPPPALSAQGVCDADGADNDDQAASESLSTTPGASSLNTPTIVTVARASPADATCNGAVADAVALGAAD